MTGRPWHKCGVCDRRVDHDWDPYYVGGLVRPRGYLKPKEVKQVREGLDLATDAHVRQLCEELVLAYLGAREPRLPFTPEGAEELVATFTGTDPRHYWHDSWEVFLRNGIAVRTCHFCWMKWPDDHKVFPLRGFGLPWWDEPPKVDLEGSVSIEDLPLEPVVRGWS